MIIIRLTYMNRYGLLRPNMAKEVNMADIEKRVDALANSITFQQFWDALGSKLIEAAQGVLPFKQRVVSSSLTGDATKLTKAAAFP